MEEWIALCQEAGIPEDEAFALLDNVAKFIWSHSFVDKDHEDGLREEIACALSSRGIGYVPQTSDDPLYDDLADAAMSVMSEYAVEKDRQIRELKELLTSVWLYVDWRYVTRQLTTEQKNLWADAIEESTERADPGEGVQVDRWWDEGSTDDQ